MKPFIALLVAIATLLLGAGVAAGQDSQQGPDRNTFEVLATLPDVAQGSTCVIGDLNNESTYKAGVVIPNTDGQIDRGNILRVLKGRLGEHDGDWQTFDVERVAGEETVGEFMSNGDGFGGTDDVVVWVGYDWHSSIDSISLVCTPPPTTTTTTTAPPTTTTTVEPPTTTTVTPPTTTTTPPPETSCVDDGSCLAITGPGQLTEILLLAAGVLILLGTAALVFPWGKD